MKKISTYLLFILLVGAIAFLYGFSKHRNDAKKVVSIQVKFDTGMGTFLTEEMVNKLLIQNKQSLKNEAKSIIDLQKLEQAVVSNPYVESASVFLTIDGKLEAHIKQRQPIARISMANLVYYVDNKGVKVPLSDNYSARVLLVTGANSEEDVKEIIQLTRVILGDDFLKKEIVGIHKTQENEYNLSVRSGNQIINLGSLENLSIKFKKLKAFYNVAFNNKTIENYKIINLKYHNQVVCTK